MRAKLQRFVDSEELTYCLVMQLIKWSRWTITALISAGSKQLVKTTSKVLINKHYRLFVKASSSGLLFSLWCSKGFKLKNLDQKLGKYITCTSCTELIFALFFKMNMLCFYLKPQDRACPFWFMEGKIVVFYSRVGPRNPCPPPHSHPSAVWCGGLEYAVA